MWPDLQRIAVVRLGLIALLVGLAGCVDRASSQTQATNEQSPSDPLSQSNLVDVPPPKPVGSGLWWNQSYELRGTMVRTDLPQLLEFDGARFGNACRALGGELRLQDGYAELTWTPATGNSEELEFAVQGESDLTITGKSPLRLNLSQATFDPNGQYSDPPSYEFSYWMPGPAGARVDQPAHLDIHAFIHIRGEPDTWACA